MKSSSRAFALAVPVIALRTALLGLPAQAQVPLNDPTRAPFQLRAPAPNPYQVSPVAAPVATASPAPTPTGPVSAPPEVEPPRHRVTSVMLGSGSRPSSAIVDGRLVRVGDRIDGLLLVGIDASGVTLQAAGAGAGKGGKATRRLPLFARPPEPPPEVEPNPKDGERPDKDKP